MERKPKKRDTDLKRNQDRDNITTVQVIAAVKENGVKYHRTVEPKNCPERL